MKKRSSFYLFVFIFFLISCKSNPLDIKLDNDNVSIEFINADEMFLNQSVDDTHKNLINLSEKLGDLFLYELSNNVQSNVYDSSFQIVYDFYNSEYIKALETEKEKLRDKLPKIEEDVNKAFQYLEYYFGSDILPKNIFYLNSLFSQIKCSDDNISVGLENYISQESEVIKSIPQEEFYQWQRNRMDINFLSRDILLAWIQVELFDELDGKFAEHIIQAGKVLYILNAAFPKESEAYILRYSKEQHEWASNNEASIWEYIVAEQLLFGNDMTTRTNFLNEGPTTIGLSQDAPDRIGQYIGYKIVKGYMNKNKSLSLQELLDTGYNNILQTYKID